jgi:4-amino-4-deoxy-L-arabinose transferase-like glycosyltransferase
LSSKRWLIWAPALLFLAALLPTLNSTLLQEVDELIYARVARAASEGHWMPLRWGAQLWSEKPPLLLWFSAALIRLGANPMASWPYRLGTCLGAAASVAGLARLAELEGGPWAALISGLGFAVLGDLVFHARFFSMDSSVLACALWAYVALAQGRYRGAGIWLALGVWIKTWFVLGFFPAAFLALWRAEAGPGFKRALAWSFGLPLLSLALATGFYALVYGRDFLNHELWWNLIDRAKGLSNPRQGSNLLFYGTWAEQAAPLILPLALAAPCLLLTKRKGVVSDLAVGLSVSWLVCLALIRAQVINYLLPLEAGLCLAWGLLWAGLCNEDEPRPWLLAGLALLQVLVLLGFLGAENALLFSGLFALLALRPLAAAEASKKLKLAFTGSATLLGALALGLMFLRDLRYLRAPYDASARLLAVLPQPKQAAEPLLYVGSQGQALDFYTQYRVEKAAEVPARRPKEAMLVMQGDEAHFYPAKTETH